MIVTVTDCPIQDFLAKAIQPEIVFDKQGSEIWMVPASPIRFDGSSPKFTLIEKGDLVRVPLFAYRTANKELHTLAGFAMELGARAALSLPERPLRFHMVLGYPVVDLPSQHYRLHLGLAFLVRR